MSIYLAKKELIDLLEKNNMKHNMKLSPGKVVAKTKNTTMKLKDYTEEKLEKLVKSKKSVTVNIEFWNYNYCTNRNIDSSVAEDFINQLDVTVENLKDFSAGTLVILIIAHEILLHTFKIKDSNIYIQYLEDNKISRKLLRNFMLNMKYELPLTENYLTLILKVFDQETIFHFLFRKYCKFELGEFEKIMEYFKLDNIHEASYYIVDKFRSKRKQLEYFKVCIILFEDKIDLTEKNVVYNKKNKSPHIGYYLLTMKIDNDLENLYYSVVKQYLDKFGTLNIISEDKEENNYIDSRKREIINYFDKY